MAKEYQIASQQSLPYLPDTEICPTGPLLPKGRKCLFFFYFFGVYGWIEFEAFIAIGNAVGGLVTFLGIFITGGIGVALMKRQGKSILQHWRSNIGEGENNTPPLASGLSLVMGAVLMLMPGYVTDFIGLLCFIPGLRTLIGQYLLDRLGVSLHSSSLFSGFSARFNSTDDFPSYKHNDIRQNNQTMFGNKRLREK